MNSSPRRLITSLPLVGFRYRVIKSDEARAKLLPPGGTREVLRCLPTDTFTLGCGCVLPVDRNGQPSRRCEAGGGGTVAVHCTGVRNKTLVMEKHNLWRPLGGSTHRDCNYGVEKGWHSRAEKKGR